MRPSRNRSLPQQDLGSSGRFRYCLFGPDQIENPLERPTGEAPNVLAVNEQAIQLAGKIKDYRLQHNNKLRQRSRTLGKSNKTSNPATPPQTKPTEQQSTVPVPMQKHVCNPPKKAVKSVERLADWDFEKCVAWTWHRFIRNP